MDKTGIKLLRSRIDRVDKRLVALMNRRAQLAGQIGKCKARRKGTLWRPEREAQVIRAVKTANEGPLSNPHLENIYRELISACLSLEGAVRIGYLGPMGTFSHEAAIHQFGSSATLVPMETIREIVNSIEKDVCDFGILPVENSTEGTVAQTLDIMQDVPVRICAEIVLRIRQHLLVKRGTSLGKIKRILSHPQSFAQCRNWLRGNLPKCELVNCSSNAGAARSVGKSSGAIAAIGPHNAATIYELDVLARDIEDDPDNNTRFWIVGNTEPKPTGADKTSIVMAAAKDEAGGLLALLEPMARHGINMTKLESRPSPHGGLWEYIFFVDLEGHHKSRKVAKALAEIRARAAILRILGSYPATS